MTKIITTLGPSTQTKEKISRIKNSGVDFVRVNMSHSSLEELENFIILAKQVGVSFIIDTEGSQVRTGSLNAVSYSFMEGDKIILHQEKIKGDKGNLSVYPSMILGQLSEGDILYVDFDTLVIRVTDISKINEGKIESTVISSGTLGNNKGVVIDPRYPKSFTMPTLTEKDIKAIELGLRYKIKHVAASFIRNKEAVDFVRNISQGKMKIISKIECKDALRNLDDIINSSDLILIDRGDLSKEIPIEKIPFAQKIIISKSTKLNKKVYVATNLLESMVQNRKPTRAEVHDVSSTIMDGAYGLTLAAETAIGNYPLECINMLNKIINYTNRIIKSNKVKENKEKIVKSLEKNKYLLNDDISSSLILPHGGKLINRVANDQFSEKELELNHKIELNENQQLDLEQIAYGAYSPLKGFMTKIELESVLEKMRLPNGLIWTIPILLSIKDKDHKIIKIGDIVTLTDSHNRSIGTIKIRDIFEFNKKLICQKLFGSNNLKHPGVRLFNSFGSKFIGGEINLINNAKRIFNKYNLTPYQTRRLFDEKNWVNVVGFHTRNVIHRAHEYIQMEAISRGGCDGLFVHPVVGEKKVGDYNSHFIIKSYEIMQKIYYPEGQTVFGVFSTYSRYAGSREAVFTAICRKNFGCSHFIVGRDHTGSGFDDNLNEDIFLKFPDIGIEIIKFNSVHYSKTKERYIEQQNKLAYEDKSQKFSLSGTEVREMFENKVAPPEWYMRPEISKYILESIALKKDVFVK